MFTLSLRILPPSVAEAKTKSPFAKGFFSLAYNPLSVHSL